MLCSISYIELTLMLDSENYENYLNWALDNSSEMLETDFGYIDEWMVTKGIGVTYYGDSKKRKIKLLVYSPSLLIGKDEDLWKLTPSNISKLVVKLEKRIAKYFTYEKVSLHDFDISRIDLAVDLDVGSENVGDYIRVLHNIRQVKFYSPMKYGKRDGETKDSTVSFKFKTDLIQINKKRNQAETVIFQTGLEAFAKVLEGYLLGINAALRSGKTA